MRGYILGKFAAVYGATATQAQQRCVDKFVRNLGYRHTPAAALGELINGAGLPANNLKIQALMAELSPSDLDAPLSLKEQGQMHIGTYHGL